MLKNLSQSGLKWLWISVIVMLSDRASKIIAQLYLTPYYPQPVMPSFNLTLAYNKGAAFSLLNHAPGWQVWFFGLTAIMICCVLLVWLKKLSVNEKWVAIALSLIIGGALGNVWDRIAYGHVIDFIEVYVSDWHWPVSNLADSAICFGTFMLLIDAFKPKNR